MNENVPQDIKLDMSNMYDYFSDDKEFQKLISEIDASVVETISVAPSVSATTDYLEARVEETKVKSRRKFVECSICQQMKRSDHLKKHMKTHEVSNTYTGIVFVSPTEGNKSKYRKHVVCPICEQVTRSDHLKRHMRTKSHAKSSQVDIVHGTFIEKLSTVAERKDDEIMCSIKETVLGDEE